MTVVIADDEEIFRDGMTRMIREDLPGFEVAAAVPDGEQALGALARLRPDVLITDICMPKVGGLDLIDQVRQFDQALKIVIVSGYDDFGYAQSALRMGVSDYLLKPVLPGRMREVLTRIRQVHEEEQSREKSLEDLRRLADASLPLVRDRFLVNVLEGRFPGGSVLDRARDLGFGWEAPAYAAGVLQFDLDQAGTVDTGDRTAVSGVDLVRQYLVETVGQAFSHPLAAACGFLAENQVGLLFSYHDPDPVKGALRVNQNGQKVLTALVRRFGVRAFLGVGCLEHRLEDLPRSLAGAREAVSQGFSLTEGRVLWFTEPGLKTLKSLKAPGADAALVGLVRLADREGARAHLEALYASVPDRADFSSGPALANGLETLLALRRAVEDHEDMPEPGRLNPPYQELLAAGSIGTFLDLLRAYTDKVVDAFTVQRAGRGADLVERAKLVVQSRFHEEHLTLDAMAAGLYVSPHYLRQLFRQKTGMTLMDYLLQVRMQRAVELLADPTRLVQEVADKTGFLNQRYFSMCFKKYFGQTPSEFRTSGQR